MTIFERLKNWWCPMCPQGGHRVKIGIVTNVNGNQYCWHPDCVRANFRNVEPPNYEEFFNSVGSLVFEGIEFYSKAELFDSIKMEWERIMRHEKMG